MPNADDLFAMGSFWDGDKLTAPTGKSYWRFMIFKYKDGFTYVLENHIIDNSLETVVKRLL